ncbi:MAG: hypothetical protein LCH76_10620 [Actinobacteria bacterium]|nr:hypothetical protein [Actinomycetota bacterium]
MTNPYDPDHSASSSPADETIPLVPDSGYTNPASPWSAGYEATAIDPLNDAARQPTRSPYADPAGYGSSAPGPLSPGAAGAYTNPTLPRPQPVPPRPSQLPPTAPVYEQPPAAYGYGPYEPARDPARAQLTPAYNPGYPAVPQQIEHPNVVPALILAVLGFVVGVTFPIAWYLGAKGNADIKREPYRYRPSGVMTFSMVLGIIGTILMALGILSVVLLVVLAIALA